MKRPWKALALIALAVGFTASLGWPESSPKVLPLGRLRNTQRSHPEMGERLVAHLRQRYPNLEVHAFRAVLKLDEKHPGLVYSLPRHVLEDLGQKPLDAAADVACELLDKYPHLKIRVAALRDEQRSALGGLLTEGWRVQLKGFLADNPFPVRRAVADSRQVLQTQFPQLAPELRELRHHPESLREGYRSLGEHQLRQALIAVLTQLEQDPAAQPTPWGFKALGFVTTTYPKLLPQAVDRRWQNRRQLLSTLRAEFPQVGQLVGNTLSTRHPGLLHKMVGVARAHYPGLLDEVWQNLDVELPGLSGDVNEWLATNYP